jgi:hypothetical protein
MNHSIRFIRYGINTVNTVAGTGVAGDSLGLGPESQLNQPWALGIRDGGDLIIADTKNYKLKRLDKGFHLLRYSGSGNRGFNLGATNETEYLDLILMDINQSGFVYLIDHDEVFGSRLLKVNQDGNSSLINEYPRANGLCGVGGVSVNNSDTLYVLETPYFDKLYSSSSSSSSEGYSSSSSSIDSSSSSSTSEGYSSSSSSFGYSSSTSSSESSSSSSSEMFSTSSSSSSEMFSTSSSSSSLSSLEYSESTSSSSSSLGECEASLAEVVGENAIVFVSNYFSEWTLGQTICLEANGQEYQGTITLLVEPAIYLTMNQSMDGIIGTGDPIIVCQGPCGSSSSTSSDSSSDSSEEYSESSESSFMFSSSSSLGECELSEILVIGLQDLVFVSGHVTEWTQGEEVCLYPKAGGKEQGFIRLITGKNVFITMDNSMSGIIDNEDVIDVCKGPCVSSSSSSSSEGYSSDSSSSSIDSSSSSSIDSSSSSSLNDCNFVLENGDNFVWENGNNALLENGTCYNLVNSSESSSEDYSESSSSSEDNSESSSSSEDYSESSSSSAI